MKGFLAAIGCGAKTLQTASTLAVIVGTIYLVDCRVSAKTSDGIDRCYFTALPIMGIGVAGKGGFAIGYNTLNPELRKEEDHTQTTDSRRPKGDTAR